MIPPELAALAEDPPAFITPFQGSERIWDQRFYVAINPRRTWVTVCRLRLAPDQVEPMVAEIRELTEGIETVTWNVGSSAEPPDLPVRLRALGFGDPEPPLDAVCAALVLAEEPPRVAGVEVLLGGVWRRRRSKTRPDPVVDSES
jgi:hypothetical protein